MRTSSRHHERPSSARRHSRDGDDSRRAEDPVAHSSTHRHRSSSARNSPHRHHNAALQEKHRFRPEDYILEDGVPPLRRQSTQPPHRRTSPTSHTLAGHRSSDAVAYHRREVEPTAPQQPTSPHARRSSRHATPVSTALVVAEERPISPRRHASRRAAETSPRRSARATPRGSRHDSRIESEDGVVRSPRQHVSPSKTSPRRAHRQAGSPIRPERRAESSRHRRASAEPHTRSPHRSARRPREEHSARTPATEANVRQDTLRYRSPPLVERAKHRSSSRHAKHSSDAVESDAERKRSSSRRHGSARHTRSDRPSSRQDSARRHSSRHGSRHRQASQDSSVAPREPSHMQTSGAAKGTAAAAGGSTYVRPNTNGYISTRRSSGSCIEVISVNSARPGSSHSWLPQSPRRPREVGPPVVIPDPRSVKLLQRIDSTRNWINNMKEEVDKDRQRELEEKQAAEAAEREEMARQREAERARKERHRGEEVGSAARRHRSSSQGSHRHRTRSSKRESNGTGHAPAPVEPERAVESRRHPRAAIAPAGHSEAPRVSPAVEAKKSAPRSTHAPSGSLRTAPSETEKSSRRSAKPAEAPVPPPMPFHDTINSSRQDGFDYPIFSFISFLDGNTFDSTAGMCDYNTQLAESLSDEHLDVLREVLFHHDEDAFAELLYGDDVQAELDVISNTLSHSEDPAVQREIVVLQRAAVRRFNDKCSAALRALLAAPGGLADAVQIAASELERRAYEAGAGGANSP